MTNNEVLKNLQNIFNLETSKITEIYNILDDKMTEDHVNAWFKRLGDPSFLNLEDMELSTFLNALICEKRGKKEGPQPEPEKEITNNIILKKLKIALDLKNEDIMDILNLVNTSMNNYELTSFFRKPNHKNYRPVRDQLLRSFLKGLSLREKS